MAENRDDNELDMKFEGDSEIELKFEDEESTDAVKGEKCSRFQGFKAKCQVKGRALLYWYKSKSLIQKVCVVVSLLAIFALLFLGVGYLARVLKTQSVLNKYALKPEAEFGSVVGEIERDDTDYLSIDLAPYTQENKDTVGYLEMVSVDIKYPVVQCGDNDYYLTKDFKHNDSKSGWVFGDFRCDFEYLGQNTVMYGHNMKDGSMFANLKYLTNDKLAENVTNRQMRFQTKEASYVYEVVSVYTSPIDFNFVENFFTNEEFQVFIDEIKARNTREVLNDSYVDIGDSLMTLVTCSGVSDRLVVHAKLVNAKYF